MHLLIGIHGPEIEQKQFLDRLKNRVKKVIRIHEIKFYDILCYKEAEEEVKKYLARQPNGKINIPKMFYKFISLGHQHILQKFELPPSDLKAGEPFNPENPNSRLGSNDTEVIAILKVKDRDWHKIPGDGQEGI